MPNNKFEKMAKKIYINTSKEVIDSLSQEYKFIQKNIDELKKINIDGVEPMSRISRPISFDDLRDDEVNELIYINKDILLNNSKDKNKDFVVMKRIIK